MITFKFTIAIYDWDIQYIEVQSSKDADAVRRILKNKNVDRDELDDTVRNIKGESVNGGEHYYDSFLRWSILLMLPTTSIAKKLDIICHEKRHIEDRITKHLGIDDLEAAAFIAGYLAEKIIPRAISNKLRK